MHFTADNLRDYADLSDEFHLDHYEISGFDGKVFGISDMLASDDSTAESVAKRVYETVGNVLKVSDFKSGSKKDRWIFFGTNPNNHASYDFVCDVQFHPGEAYISLSIHN